MLVSDDPAPSKGHTWGDFDNDGDLDLYVANGTEGTPAIRNFLYLNRGNGDFVRVVAGAPVEDAHISAGTAWADVERDGDLDLVVANWADADEDNDFYRNETIDTGQIVALIADEEMPEPPAPEPIAKPEAEAEAEAESESPPETTDGPDISRPEPEGI